MIVHGTADRHIPIAGGAGKLAKWGFNVHAKPLDWSVNFWVKADGCSSEPETVKDGAVTRRTYAGGRNDSEVVLYLLDGYAHSWPGGTRAWWFADTPSPDLSATDTCWDFFSRHSKGVEGVAAAKQTQVEHAQRPGG